MTCKTDREILEKKLQELFSQSVEGKAEAYAEFLSLASVVLKRELFFTAKVSSEIREDLLQEALIKVHTKKHTYIPHRPMLPWLQAIARHTFVDYYRKEKRSTFPVIPALEETTFDFPDLESLLTPEQFALLTKIKVEGAPYAEAAASLNMSVSHAKVSVHRMIKMLREKL